MSEKIKVSYAELKRLIVSETLLEKENQELKERVKTLESLYKYQSKEFERLKEELEGWTLVEDEEELLDD
ncbi:hypothetical protein WER97_11800 [Staphylococcus felis]|uniref:hypothetical protein n=1 Tax=Staphylococcus felis TaxID=46127 RepID=UPI0039673B59